MNLFGADEEALPLSEAEFTAVVGDSLLVGTEYRHAWTEQSADPTDGSYSDAVPARSGTTTLNYLVELSGRQVVKGTLVRAWFKSSVNGEDVYECLAPDFTSPTTYVGQTFNYTDCDFHFFYGNVIHVDDTLVFKISENYSVVVLGPGYWLYDAPLVICGWQFWCYVDYIVSTGTLIDWTLPATRDLGEATVFRMIDGGSFAIASIVPADLGTTSQENGPRAADGGAAIDGPTWDDAGNVFFNDGLYATVTLPEGETTAWLAADHYGFAVPAGAHVTGVKVTIRRGKDAGPGVIDVTTVTLSGFAHSSSKFSLVDWPDADGDLVLGGSSDSWGVTWTPGEINGDDFRVSLRAGEGGTGTADLRVDSVLVTVYYTLADAGQVIALLNLSGPTMTLLHDSPSGTSGYRLFLENSTNKEVPLYGVALLWYDPAASCWRCFRDANRDFDEHVKITNADKVTGHLADKLVAGANVTLTVLNAGADEQLQIDVADADVFSLVSGEDADNSILTLTNTYANLHTISLVAGTYLLLAQVTGVLNSGAGGDQLFVKFRNTTDGVDVGDPGEFCYLQAAGIMHETVTLETRLVLSGTKTIALQGKYVAIGVPTVAQTATLRMTWVKTA
jgi:hypothetical protein